MRLGVVAIRGRCAGESGRVSHTQPPAAGNLCSTIALLTFLSASRKFNKVLSHGLSLSPRLVHPYCGVSYPNIFWDDNIIQIVF